MNDPIKPSKVEVELVCPECGVSLKYRNVFSHALSHWNEYLDPARSGKQAIERQKKCLAGGVTESEYIKAHKE